LHPRWAFGFGHSWSKHNRLSKGEKFLFSGSGEPLVKFAEDFQKRQPSDEKVDYFIFGHYHYNAHCHLDNGGEMFMLGEWINHYDYLLFDGVNIAKGFYLKNIE